MTQAQRPRGGWREEETALLFQAVEQAEHDGKPLRDAFGDVGARLGRKPNSIRNYYYARVRERPDMHARKTPFRTFSDDELHWLLREVLLGRAQGESVRACVTRLSQGDRSRMLRYQNKYRAVLKGRPELLTAVAQELRAEGHESVPCEPPRKAADEATAALYRRAVELSVRTGDRTLKALLESLLALLERIDAPVDEAAHALEISALTERLKAAELERVAALDAIEATDRKWQEARRENDRLKVQVDLLKLRLEDLGDGKDVGRPLL